MTGEPVRIGLIGFGAWGRFHAQAITQTRGACLGAICSRSRENAEAARTAYPGVPVYDSYAKMLREQPLDAVAVVLPSYLHAEVGVAALEQGLNVLMEKPLATSMADCRRLLEAAGRSGKLLAVGHELRCSSLWGTVKTLIEEQKIGRPQYVLVELSRRPYRLGTDGWRYDRNRVGSWILEEPIHFFDLARWYLASEGEPQSVYAVANSRQDDPQLHDNVGAVVRFSGGAFAVIAHTLAAFEHHQTVKVAGTGGAIWASWSGQMDRTFEPHFQLRWSDGNQIHTLPIDRPAGEVFELNEQYVRFVQVIRGQGKLVADGLDGLWAVAMCLAAERSVGTGTPVALELPAIE